MEYTGLVDLIRRFSALPCASSLKYSAKVIHSFWGEQMEGRFLIAFQIQTAILDAALAFNAKNHNRRRRSQATAHAHDFAR